MAYKMTDTQPLFHLIRERSDQSFNVDPVTFGRVLQLVETLDGNVRALANETEESRKEVSGEIRALIAEVRREIDALRNEINGLKNSRTYAKGIFTGARYVTLGIVALMSSGVAAAVVKLFELVK